MIRKQILTQQAFTCSKSIVETIEKRCEICSKLTVRKLEPRR